MPDRFQKEPAANKIERILLSACLCIFGAQALVIIPLCFDWIKVSHAGVFIAWPAAPCAVGAFLLTGIAIDLWRFHA